MPDVIRAVMWHDGAPLTVLGRTSGLARRALARALAALVPVRCERRNCTDGSGAAAVHDRKARSHHP